MKTIVTIIGARPQIIKAAALSRSITTHFSAQLREVILHTGQHYDDAMSEVFFTELNIPKPDYNLNVGSLGHGAQTAKMVEGIEAIILKEKPNAVLVYGDTNSTLAGAIAASKIHVPVIHVEAGLRSFNKQMPEEVNRILCDHVSTLLFTPTKIGLKNLYNEGFSENVPPFNIDNPGVFHCGDVMFDNSLYFAENASNEILERNKLVPEHFVLCTIHRNTNTDDAERLSSIFSALLTIANECPVVLPIHPRTAGILEKQLKPELYKQVKNNPQLQIIPPASFLEMISLEKNCRMVITDSGGVQKEAYFFRKPCIILRTQTEWIELVEAGAATIADANSERILNAWHEMKTMCLQNLPLFYGDGHSADFIAQTIIEHIP